MLRLEVGLEGSIVFKVSRARVTRLQLSCEMSVQFATFAAFLAALGDKYYPVLSYCQALEI